MERYPKDYLYKRIVQAKLFIDEHYAQQLLTEDISGEAFFSKFHFIRLFKQTYGKTPHQYLTFVRIAKASELLRAGRSVAEVCGAVGFESLSAFGSLFKRRAGMAPSAYLEQHQALKRQALSSPLAFVPGCIVHQLGLGKK